MAAWLRWFNASLGQIDGVARAALAHLWFEAIHPFEDGNGRIGRAVAELALAPAGEDDASRPGWPWVNVSGVRMAPPGDDATDIGWPITPDGLRAHLVRLRDDYPGLPPVCITENGAAYDDPMGPDGRIDDARRVAFLRDHIASVAAARAEGVDVRGYFAWSLMDNFEWAEGYAMRFGIVHVDFETLVRTPRRSYHWYADLLRAGAPLDLLH